MLLIMAHSIYKCREAMNRFNNCELFWWLTSRLKSVESEWFYAVHSGIKHFKYRGVTKKKESAYKPGSVESSHSSRRSVTRTLKQSTQKPRGPRVCFSIWSCFEWSLPCHTCYQLRGALLPHHFTLTYHGDRRYIFCGTCRRLTPPRHYLAPCPMKPGLSSLLSLQ